MALIDKASLLMVPSTYEAGKLYNVLPSGNRAPDSTNQNSGYDQTRADFDFDRGSNASATRIGSDGLIKKYRENLLLQSNQFDTTWTNVNSTETSGQSGYDGSSNAWVLTLTGGTATKLITQSTSTLSGVYNTSFYAKAGTHSIVQIGTSTQSNIFVCFDLSDGSVGSLSSNAIDAKATSIANGWYRIEVTFLATNATGISIAGVDSISATRFQSTSSTGNFYIQSAQLESGLVATDVLTSGATTAKAGVLVDLPRINYDANGENGALLLEPSRQNLLQFSEYFGASYWTKSGDVTLASNYGTSPEGVQNADRIVANATSGGHIVYRNISTTGTHTISIFAKASGYNHLFLGYDGGSLNFGIIFNLSNGTIAQNPAGLTGSIEAVGSDGWHRCNLTFNYATTSYYFVVAPHDNSGNYNWTGNGTDGILIYGAQLEPNATYVSSYIPTMGTSETRAGDSCSVTGVSDVIGQTEGTLYFEGSVKSDGANVVFFEIVNGTDSSNTMTLYINNSNNNLEMYNPDAGPNVNILKDGNNQGVDFKLALAYQSNDYVCYVNGVQTYIDNSANVPISMNGVYIGQNRNGVEKGLTIAKQAVLFKERLSNAELAALTA